MRERISFCAWRFIFFSLTWNFASLANGMLKFSGLHRLGQGTTYRIPWTQATKSQFTSSTAVVAGANDMQLTFYSSILSQTTKEVFPQNAIPFATVRALYYQRRRRGGVIWMGKGDGKKQRKKKSAAEAAQMSSAAAPPSPPQPNMPLRVSNHINIPVRHQIRLAQLNKEATTHEGSSFRQKKVDRTSYRRTWDEEEIEVKKEERRRKGQDPDWSVILNRTASAPLVIVDGYNIIHKWPRLKKHMTKGDPQRARELLVDDLEGLRSLKGWRIEVVFDGNKRSTVGPLGVGPGSKAVVTRVDHEAKADVTRHGVRVVFTGVGVEADSYIEARCAQAKNVTHGETTGSFIIVTDDVMIRMAGLSAGALCMAADRLVDELRALKKAMAYRVEAAVAKVNGHAIRPEALRAQSHPSFGKRQIVIEDKRNRTKIKQQRATDDDDDDDDVGMKFDIQVEEDENGIPWWAKVPNHTHFRHA